MSSLTEDECIELELLRDQEIDALIENELLPEQERWKLELRNGFMFTYPEVVVEVTTGHPYPLGLPKCQVHNLTLPRIMVDKLRIALRETVERDRQSNSFEKWIDRATLNSSACFDFEMTVLHIAAKTLSHVEEYRTSLLEAKAQTGEAIISRGINLSAIEGNALVKSILSKTPEEICAQIPGYFRILHIETVIRNDLYSDFRVRQESIRNELLEKSVNVLKRSVSHKTRRPFSQQDAEKSLLINHLIHPRVTFHGTLRHHVPSIVRHGFLLPGDLNPNTNQPIEVRCGNTYGKGIYSSPSAEFSLSYSGLGCAATKTNEYDGLKLIVCATVMGISSTMTCSDNWRTESEPFPGAQSHVSVNQFEYVVFNRAQILPCYVIHLDWGKDNAIYFENIPLNPQTWINQQQKATNAHKKLHPENLAPGDKQRAKEAIVSKAAKYFSYGYGPATGNSFVVEEVGEVDEDEEEYGMYQEDRIEKVDGGLKGEESRNIWDWGNQIKDESMTRDEYYEARRASRRRGLREVE